uniref:SAP domain-containing protein n=1 Tax=Aegilops tauschii TaxID=37682 RepID=M8B4M7_AEGTA
MKRRELQALCKEHGLKANGSNADLAARLAATLSIPGGAEEDAVGVVVGKGCLKRSFGGASGGDSDAAKKVTFVLEEEEEAEVGADAVTRRHRRNAANLGAGDVVERVAGAVGRKTSAKAEQQELDSGEAVGRKHQLKRKASENDADNLDVSVQVGVSRRSTRSSAVQSEPAAAPSPVVHNKRGRKKAGDLKEQDRVKEQPTEIQHVGRTLRSGLVVAGPPLPTVSENKRSRSKVPEGETDVEKVAEVEISGRTTRSSSVPAAATSPIVVAKKRRKTKNVNSDEGQHTVPDVSNDSPVTRVLRNRAIQTIGSTDLKVALPTMLNAAKDGVEDGVAKQDGHVGSKKRKMLNRRATVATNGGEIPFSDSSGKASAMDMHVEVPGPVRRSMRKSVVPSFLEHETKGMHGDVEMKETVTKPVGRSTRRSVAPVILEKESKGLTKPVEIKETVTKPVGRSTWRSVATVILEKECKGLPKEMIPQVHVKRPTKKSLVPAMTVKGTKSIVTDMIPEARAGRSMRKPALAILNSKKNDHCEAAIREKCSSAKSEDLEKQQTVKQPVRRLTRKSFVPAVLEKDRKAVPAEMNPDAQFNNENGDHTKMKCAKGGHLEKQLVVKEPSRQSTHKSVAPHVIEKEIKGLQEESKSEVPVSTSVRKLACLNVVDKESKDHREIVPHVIEKESKGSQEESKSDVPVRTSVRKLAGPNAVDKESKDHSEIVRREESSVRTRSAQTKLQRSVQNDASLRQTRHRSSKLVISPLPSKPTASKGRPAKRSRTASLEEVMPAEEQKEDQIAYGGHTSDMIDVASSANSLESGVLPSPAEKSDLRDSHLNTQLEGTVVESSISHGKDVSNILEFELESTVVGTTEKPPSDLAIPDCTHVGALSEEALDSIENDAARCSPVLEQSPTGLQFLFSQGNIEEPDTHNTSPFFKNVMEESDVHKVECQGETVVSLKPDSYQGSDEYSIRVEESGGLMFSSQQNNEQEGFSVSTLRKDWVASVQLDSSEDLHHTVRDITRKDVICNEEEKTDFIPSDINAPHEKSHADEPAEHVSGVSGALFCISQSTTVVDEVNSDSSPLESVDALDNHIASSNTEGLQQDNIEECNLHNARVTEDIHASVMSEAAQVAVPESGKMLQPDVETLVLSDEQLKRKLEGDDLEVQSFSRGEDESPKQSTSCEDQSFLGSGICQTVSRRDTDVVCVKDHRDDCNQHSEGQLTLGNLESDMSEPALDERSESGISVLRAEETSPFPDEQLNTKLEGNTEQTLICDKDSSNVSLTEFLGNNHLSSLKDPTMDPCHDQELPNDMPAPKSPEESAVFLDDKVLGSVQSLSCDKDGSIVSDTGSLGNKNLSSMEDPSMDPCHVQELPCGPSMDPCHDQELPGDMPAPKSPKCSVGICQISASIGKGNHIAIDPHHTVKQLDNLNQSAAALLRNRENTPCPDTLEPSSDHLFVIDPSTPMEPLLTEAGLKVGSSDKKLPMEQVQQDDLQVQEGTVGKTALGSATPECKHECVSPDKAGPHSLKNERYPSSIEQSLFDQQSLSSQEDVQVQEGTLEKTALGSTTPECEDEYGFPDEADPHSLKNERARVQAENGVCESNPGSDHDTSADFSAVSKSEDCLDTSQQDNENEGLSEVSHEQDDFQVQEGTVEKTTLGSDLPECKHEFGLPAEAEPHSLMNQRSSIEQSAFGPQSLILKEEGQGTVEKIAVDSATPECKHECVSPDKAGPHSLKNERYPSSIAQSSFDLQPFSLQDDVQVHEGTLEKTAQGSATPECKDEYGFPDEADPHSLKNERASVQAETGVNESKPGLDNDTTVDFSTVSKSEDCLVTSQQDNEDEGLTKASNEQEQVATGQLDLEAASIMEDADSEEVAYDEENKKPVHPTDINSLCQKINVSGPVEHASGLGDALLSSSLIACTDDSDVHLSSNPCLFESTDFPDEIDWSNTEALQQGLKKQQCDERKEYQVPFGAGNDMIEAGTKDINSGVPPLRAEETSNMRDEQLNTKLPRTEVAEFGLSCDKGSNNYLDTESVVNSVCTNIPSDSSLPTDCSTDDYQQMELFEGPAEQKSPEDASMCYKDSDPRAVTATIEKPSPSFDLAIPDFKHEGPLSEEAVYSMKNDTESCSRDHRRSSIGLRHLFSQESFKGPDVHDDLVLPSTENEDDSNTRHAEKIVSSEPDSHQGSPVDLSIVEEIKGLFSSERDDEQGFLSPGHKTECIASARLDSSEDCNLVKRPTCRDINTEVICKEEEKQELVPSSDTRTLHETSNTDEPDEQRITLLQAAETSASADKQLSSELEDDEFKEHNFSSEETIGIFGVGSVKSNLFHLHEDSHTNPIQGKELPDNLSAPKSPEQSTFGQAESLLGSGICQAVVQRSTEEINTKLQHERKEECSKYIDDQTTLMSECALFGGSVSGTTLLPTAETSSLPDEQFGPMLECDEFEERDRSYDEDASYLFGSGSLKNNVPNLGHKEEYYEHSDDPAILSGGMPKPSPIRESESGVALQPAEETPALTNEHLNFEMEELGLCISDMSDTGLMENNDLSCLPKDTYMETWNEDEISIGTPAAKSPGESAVCPDDRVPGSVGQHISLTVTLFLFARNNFSSLPAIYALLTTFPDSLTSGICQTSGRRRIDEISTKLLSFKISSAVKGSYIAMDSADEPKQGDNLSPAALPGNWENVSAAKADNPAKQNSDCSVVKDSSS